MYRSHLSTLVEWVPHPSPPSPSLLQFLALTVHPGLHFTPSRLSVPHTPAPTHFSHCDGSLAAPNCDDEAWLRSISSICPRPIWAARQDFYACVGGNNTPDWSPPSQICGSAGPPKPQSLTLSTAFLLIARRSTNHLWQWQWAASGSRLLTDTVYSATQYTTGSHYTHGAALFPSKAPL
ncbi:hypothetical protein CSAL01_09244 [Colletotrichum salicis]|uniref:Uncharacterized protein n=1 Tax=Colletotrichum salicis TaxID=1209931 RepID=A0A135TNX5_9PEZI|nr:hypothetical protein CSAL01_09244 [Colletotrichum salicis]